MHSLNNFWTFSESKFNIKFFTTKSILSSWFCTQQSDLSGLRYAKNFSCKTVIDQSFMQKRTILKRGLSSRRHIWLSWNFRAIGNNRLVCLLEKFKSKTSSLWRENRSNITLFSPLVCSLPSTMWRRWLSIINAMFLIVLNYFEWRWDVLGWIRVQKVCIVTRIVSLYVSIYSTQRCYQFIMICWGLFRCAFDIDRKQSQKLENVYYVGVLVNSQEMRRQTWLIYQ